MSSRIPVRLIICVDGTCCDPDGPASNSRAHRNVTNVYRLCASIQKGICTDKNGKTFKQEKKYFPGIASEDNKQYIQRAYEGTFGENCLEQIRDVYRECCRLDGPEDEVWLYGFSRGAWVVRAVAGLLHYIRVLSADTTEDFFQREYDKALKIYRKMQAQDKLGQGQVCFICSFMFSVWCICIVRYPIPTDLDHLPAQIHSMLSSATRPAPTIRFVGVFDTVKAVNDAQLFDISFNDSIFHMRHALALNEDRAAMQPECIYPSFTPRRTLSHRTFVQSWFIGAHIDIGGSSQKDGLSLYPLQWMLIESRETGLCLKFEGSFGGRAHIDDCLKLTGLCEDAPSQQHVFTTMNKLELKMMDIRSAHNDSSEDRYKIQINRARSSIIWKRKARKPFHQEGGQLEGHCGFAPQGTIIHPSVYLILDEHMSTCLNVQNDPFYKHLLKWRLNSLGLDDRFPEIPNMGFWNMGPSTNEPEDFGAIRILVCGNTGVGKSSLINKIFGLPAGKEVTSISHRSSGVHNVKEPITWPDRPDIIIHDSGGFEAAALKEFEAIEDFLREKSEVTEIDDRLHAIWFCLETNATRPTQEATKSLFQAISNYAQDIPVIVIATKMDEFLAIKQGEKRKQLKEQGERVSLESLEAMDEYAESQLRGRLEKIEEEIHGLEGGRFDACVAVARDDRDSIEELSRITSECFSHDKVRLLYIRAQVARIDLKMSLAIGETMRIYRNVLKSSISVASVPLLTTTNRFSAAVELCRVILTCFGIPSVTPGVAFDICKKHIFDDIGSDFAVFFAECIASVSMVASIGSFGLPFFLIPMTMNVPLVVPAAERLILMLACDLILIFSRSFKEATAKCLAQPEIADLVQAASSYKNVCKEVHSHIATKMPKRNVLKFFRVAEVEEMLRNTIQDFKMKVMKDSNVPIATFRNPTGLQSPGTSTTPTSASHRSSDSGVEGLGKPSLIDDDDREVLRQTQRQLQENGQNVVG
ncbi:hypothetical protein PG995_010497 [Apiospora arundinis]